jgi:endonuclease/exonuclease/phosphatase family metal-dependent hydrolase
MKKHFLILLIIAYSSSSLSFAQQKDFTQNCELKILSWNIKMLPGIIVPSGKIRRSKRIAIQLQNLNYDIIVFQEAFHAQSRNIISKKLSKKYPHQYGPANKRWYSLKTNSGIWVLSKIPLHILHEIDYRQCEKEDCFARKGALMLQGNWQGHDFQIIGTHLEAGGPDAIRESQFLEIKNQLIDVFAQDSIPLFICGDMNTGSGSDLYNKMLSILDATDGCFEGNITHTIDNVNNDMTHSTKSKVIDYFLVRNKTQKEISIVRTVSVLKKRWNKNHQDLSDHFGVAATIQF